MDEALSGVEPKAFEVGALVTIKSGGPAMTVFQCDGGECAVCWFGPKMDFQQIRAPAHVFKRVDE